MSPTPLKPTQKNPNKPTPVKVNIPHKDQIPIWMLKFIKKVTDVTGDGHCGFRAVAVLRHLTIDDHQLIRYNLYKELVGVENARYRRMINDDKRYKEVYNALSYSGIGNAPRDKWMTMLDMGLLIAQKFNQVVVVLSIGLRRSTTYFPLCGPPPTCISRLMCLAYVNDNHFMALDLKDDCSIPPTCNLWRRHHREDAQSWPDRYVTRMSDYNELSWAAGQEVVEDDEELYIIENLDRNERVGPIGPGPGVKVEVDDSHILIFQRQ
jgi:hypothetical protein